MKRERVEALRAQAVAAGLLPPEATLPAAEERPWPVVLLTAFGAWLAALPLLGVVGMLLGPLLTHGGGLYVVGLLMLAGAVVVLRSRDVPLFVEQLAVPALLVGLGSLGGALFQDLKTRGGAAAMALVVLLLAALLRRAWLGSLLGAAAALLAVLAAVAGDRGADLGYGGLRDWAAWHAGLAVWLVFLVARRRPGLPAAVEAWLEPVAAGWLLAVLGGLAWWSGMTFLAGAALGGGLVGEIARDLGHAARAAGDWQTMAAASALLAGVAGAAAARAWPGLRQPAWAAVAAVLAALAWFMPTLGASLLVLALCSTQSRWRLAGTAALAAAWIVGAFYYALAWPLATKAAVLAGAGVLLGLLAVWAGARLPRSHAPDAQAAAPGGRWARAGVAASLLATLAVANSGIAQKESLIAHGRPVFVELAPVDPRSLMQGDYMRLAFRLPDGGPADEDALRGASRPRVVARLDERGVATLLRVDNGGALAEGELRIELAPRGGRWVLVTDAWFFREGESARWAKAKYAEFRVEADGRALLVNLRGESLQPL